MNDIDRSLGAHLPRLDEDRARAQTAMIGAFNRRLVKGLHTRARLAPERDRRAAAGWLRFRTRTATISIAPLLIDGALAHVSVAPGQPDAIAAAALLGPIEPLVAAMEVVFGDELHPDGLDTSVSGDPILIRLDAGPPGSRPSTRLLVALSPDIAIDPLATHELQPAALDGVRLGWKATLAGPAVPNWRIAALAVNDLIMLGIGPLRARLSFPGHVGGLPATIELAQGVMIVQDEVAGAMTEAGAPQGSTPNALPADLAQVRVPTVIELAGGSVAAGDLATLAPGSVLPLPANGGTLSVTLRAGDTAFADGQLVAIGGGFGVLVTAIHAVAPQG